jgi:hypothetical protein
MLRSAEIISTCGPFPEQLAGRETINNLVTMAVLLFIVAATVWRFVADP